MSYTREIAVTKRMVKDFANAVGDKNPIHLDEKYAETTRFKQTIAHGALIGGLVSRMLVEAYGEGTNYVTTRLNFLAPVYVNSNVNITLTTQSTYGKRTEVEVQVSDAKTGLPCVTGYAEIIPGKK